MGPIDQDEISERGESVGCPRYRKSSVLDFWGSIKQCIPTFCIGACYQIAANSTVNIKNNPWLITTLDFRILEEVEIPSHLQFVRHLMEADGTQWNTGVIPSIFPTAISNNILNTPISTKGARETDLDALHVRESYSEVHLQYDHEPQVLIYKSSSKGTMEKFMEIGSSW